MIFLGYIGLGLGLGHIIGNTALTRVNTGIVGKSAIPKGYTQKW